MNHTELRIIEKLLEFAPIYGRMQHRRSIIECAYEAGILSVGTAHSLAKKYQCLLDVTQQYEWDSPIYAANDPDRQDITALPHVGVGGLRRHSIGELYPWTVAGRGHNPVKWQAVNLLTGWKGTLMDTYDEAERDAKARLAESRERFSRAAR